MTPPTDPRFEALLTYLKEARGFDFTGYKRSSLMRRVGRRMTTLRIADYGEYLDHLQVHPDEFTALFNTVLINVTGFFRDAEAWDYLRAEVLEPLVAEKPAATPIRLWSAGCASGEEAYTLAMLLAEILGPEQFRQRVKIYATDVDEVQLDEARHASYDERSAAAAVPPELLERYFEPQPGNRFVFRKDLRRSVIFGRNDLVQDAPISRIDVLSCRNTLMYFNAETQARILNRFHFALVDRGALFLGKAEMLLSHGSVFVPADLKRRVFRKVPRPAAPNGAAFGEPSAPAERHGLVGLDQLRGEAFRADPVAQVIVTADGLVALSNRRADTLFGVSARDVGRPFRDLEISYRPADLRKYIEQAQVERRPLRLTDIEYARPGAEALHLEVQINPLVSGDSSLLGVALIFHDVTAARRLRDELEHANRELESAYEELQSTVEELETTNEELQSTNDELQSMNDQLHRSTAELDRANAFLDAVFAGLRAGVAVVDRHLLNLDIGPPIAHVRPPLKRALTGDRDVPTVRLEAVDRRGRAVTVRVSCAPLNGANGEVTGAIVVMETDEPAGSDAAIV
ncbi:CheR family methyltransferase [Spirilliplanes yamanashiensis]|uniref:protein-glutamate O-methyltransferase n=1 Tax=Spirilliplanes yamanashiensis TaxID=42233 RepID=A0A8J3Y7H1_9ACTN|nr:CheR family methyltransferase [Spirilliplanes yamanashiensis]MDP9817505.1 two-component system CheB/CheR fusion protein [Spirilliplanes yamanashiensis]GIJ02842.1 chemotaxis protein CheR [Spirilliplanes yamanashiensis]